MSISAKERLEFVYKVVDGLEIKWRKLTLETLISDCCAYLDAKRPSCIKWEEDILDAMHICLSDLKNRKGVESRLISINMHADMHPEKGCLVTDLARRALTGELRENAGVVEIKVFSDQMERMFIGDLTSEAVWDQAWQRLNEHLNMSLSEES